MISIIVPCYAQFKLTKDFLCSLPDNTSSSYEVVLIDDCSSDETNSLSQKDYGIDKLVRHKTNLGFPKSVNDGIKESSGEYIAVFNNDVVVKNDWDTPLVKALTIYPEIGMVMGRCYDSEEMFVNSRLVENTIRVWDRGLPFFFKREVAQEIGDWDERYFPSWYDDIDMEIRLVNKGYVFGVAESSMCIHYGSQTIGKGDSNWGDYKSISEQKFKEKWNLTDASAFINFKKLLETKKVEVADWDEYHKMVYVLDGGMQC